jgi:hypothetical protein
MSPTLSVRLTHVKLTKKSIVIPLALRPCGGVPRSQLGRDRSKSDAADAQHRDWSHQKEAGDP